jgi:hypothetical protein
VTVAQRVRESITAGPERVTQVRRLNRYGEETMATRKDTNSETRALDRSGLEDAIRLRAYEISQSADAGTPEENWERAVRELGPGD